MVEALRFVSQSHLEAPSGENPAPLPWREKARLLAPNQRTAAEIAFSVELMRVINHEVNLCVPIVDKYPVNSSQNQQANEKRLQYVAGMLDLYHAKKQSFTAEQKLKAQWGEEADVIDSRLNARIQEIDHKKDKIFSDATTWGPADGIRVSREASDYAYTLPQEQRIHLYERAGFTPEDIKSVLPRILIKQYGVEASKHIASAALNFTSAHALEATAFTAGVAAAATNLLSDADKTIVIAIVVASYLTWSKGLVENAKENFDLLETEGVSTSYTSKLLYDASKKVTDDKTIHKAAAHTGFVIWQAALEIPWYISAFWSAIGIPSRAAHATGVDPKNSEWSYIAGANFAAAAYNLAQAKGTQLLLEHKDQLKHIGDKVKYFRKKPNSTE